MAEKDYTRIDDPYNGFMERSANDFGLGSLYGEKSGGSVNSDGTSDNGASDAAGTSGAAFIGSTAVSQQSDIAPNSVGSQSITDLFIESTIQSRNYQPKKVGFKINGRTGEAEFNNTVFVSNVVVTTINATSGSIGGFTIGNDFIEDTNNSFGLASTVTGANDVRFWAGDTFANRATAPFRVHEDGSVVAGNIVITGGSVPASILTGSFGSGLLDIADRGWTQTAVFSALDADTVQWTSGIFKASDGTVYTISPGNTGNMSAKTYIYLDINVSNTIYQTTTIAGNAMGSGKVLIGVALNGATEATFQLFGGIGGQNVPGSDIVAGSITSNEIAANTIIANNIAAGSIDASRLNVSQLSAITADMGNITAGTISLASGGYLRSGQTAYNSGVGFFLGNVAGTPKFSLGDSSGNKITWDGTTLTITGSISATTGQVGGFDVGADYVRDVANSFGLASTVTGGDDTRFWAGATFANRATAPFRVTESGVVIGSNITISGGSVAASILTGSVPQATLNIANRGWTQTSAFSVTDADTVAWGAGTFTSADGTAYSISSGNTGNMAAKTYIYLDIGTSTTAYQTTTTPATAVGLGKVLIGVAQNNTTEATFQLFGGTGGLNIDGSAIVAASITGNEVAANTITAGKLSVSTLSAISADLGNITAGTITMPSGGFIKSGQTAYDTGTGFFFGNVGGISKFSIGDGSANKVTWDGSTLTITGSISATTGTIGGFDVGADYVRDAANSFGLASTVTGGDDTRFWAGDTFANRATAPFRVTEAGVLTANGGGTIGGISLGSNYLRSSNFVTGALGKGFNIASDGTAEFQDVKMRGTLRTSIFEKNTISAIGGNMLVTPADTLGADMTASDTSHLNTTGVTFPVGTILRIKDGTDDEWMQVTAVSTFDHTVTRDLAAAYGAGANPIWKKGTAVVSMAKSGNGFIELDTSTTNSPYIRIQKRNSTTYSDTDTKVLIGQLKDKTGVDEYGLWVKGESVYIGGYKLFDAIATKDGAGGTTLVYYNGATYTTIKDCIDAAQTAGASSISIYVRKGTFVEQTKGTNHGSTGWTINVNITGEDPVNSLISLDTAQVMWKFNGKLYMRNISFAANAAYYAPITSSGKDLYLENVSVTNSWSNATGAACVTIYSTHTATVGYTIKDCTLISNDAATNNPNQDASCIYIVGTHSNVTIRNNNLLTSSNGIFCDASSDQTNFNIADNLLGIRGHATNTPGKGIYVYNVNMKKSLITNNIVYNSNGSGTYPHGIYFNGDDSTFNYNKILGNAVTGATTGMYVKGAGLITANNTVADCSADGIVVQGGNYQSANMNFVTNNSVANCTNDGISMIGSNLAVMGNAVYNCATGVGDRSDTARRENIMISSNFIRKCSTYGVSIGGPSVNQSCEYFLIENNNIIGDVSVSKAGSAIRLGTFMYNVNIIGNNIYWWDKGVYWDPRIDSNGIYWVIANNNFYQLGSQTLDFRNGTGTGQVDYMRIIGNNMSVACEFRAFGSGSIYQGNQIQGRFYVSGQTSGMICDNYFLGQGTSHSVDLGGTFSGKFCGNMVSPGTNEICLYISGNVNDATFTDNTLGNSISGEGIYIAGTTERVTIDGNVITKGDNYYGIYFNNDVDFTASNEFKGSTITGNAIRTNSNSGNKELIYVNGNMYNTTVTGNRLHAGASSTYAIRITGTGQRCAFTGNRLSNNLSTGTSDGINMGTNTGCTFTGNIKT